MGPRQRQVDPYQSRSRLQQGFRALVLRTATAVTLGAGLTLSSQPAQAQRVVPKISSVCPLGYVDLLNGKCSTLGLMTYTVEPTNGEACPSGWMNVGGGYCRKK